MKTLWCDVFKTSKYTLKLFLVWCFWKVMLWTKVMFGEKRFYDIWHIIRVGPTFCRYFKNVSTKNIFNMTSWKCFENVLCLLGYPECCIFFFLTHPVPTLYLPVYIELFWALYCAAVTLGNILLHMSVLFTYFYRIYFYIICFLICFAS